MGLALSIIINKTFKEALQQLSKDDFTMQFGGLELYQCTNFYSFRDVFDCIAGIKAASSSGWVSKGYYISNNTGI